MFTHMNKCPLTQGRSFRLIAICDEVVQLLVPVDLAHLILAFMDAIFEGDRFHMQSETTVCRANAGSGRVIRVVEGDGSITDVWDQVVEMQFGQYHG